MKTFIICVLLLLSTSLVQANNDMIMGRSMETFPETILNLQEIIKEKGYQVSHVQRVDIGLTNSGFKTDKFRVVFFGKPEQMAHLTEQYPQLVPYLPLAISVFAEEDETIINTLSPVYLLEGYKDPELQDIIMQWDQDIREIVLRATKEE